MGLLLPAFALTLGCALGPTNPSFPLTTRQAREELREMRAAPAAPLARPVLIVGGWLDPFVVTCLMHRRLRPLAGEGEWVLISFGLTGNFETARARLLDTVEAAMGADDTEEVDVVAFSSGGLVARYAAVDTGDGRRIRIARLFTLSSPHQGSPLAKLPAINRLQVDMRPDSRLLRLLEAEGLDYSVYSFVRLGDLVVREENATVPGLPLWWLPTPPLRMAHMGVIFDQRILAEIGRHLRGEPTYTAAQAAPLPGSDEISGVEETDGSASAGYAPGH